MMNNNTTEAVAVKAKPLSLADAYELWLDSPHPKLAGLRNRDRQANDLKNHERALRCFSIAAGRGETELDKVPLESLVVTEQVVAKHVREGARLLSQRSGKAESSPKTISNHISCVKAIQKAALEGKPEGMAAKRRIRQKAKRNKDLGKAEPRFFKADFPEDILRQWAEVEAWLMADTLPLKEGRYRNGKARTARSMLTHYRRIHMYLGWFVKIKGFEKVDLEDLANPDNYLEYMNWYLNRGTGRGYCTARDLGTTLGATVSRYLVAKGRLPEFAESGRPIWKEFYTLSEKAIEIGASRGELPVKEELDGWTPEELIEVAEDAWDTPPPSRGPAEGPRYQRQVIAQKRSAVILRLAPEAPLRIRNWREMRWGKNLFRNKDGNWTVHFRGSELKVSTRKGETNEQRYTFTQEASRWIDRWRDQLEVWAGPDFEEKCPFVFPPSDLSDRMCHDSSLRNGLQSVVWELRDKPFHPHMMRHIVATHIITKCPNAMAGVDAAAKLLGNTRQTVMNAYLKPNTDETINWYLESLKKNKKK